MEHNYKGDHLDDKGQHPGQGVGDVQALLGVVGGDTEDGVNPQNADTADAKHRNDHGQEGRAHAP